jgi:hypothetical protein
MKGRAGTLRRTGTVVLIVLSAITPAAAKIDTRCPNATATSAIAGYVEDASGTPVSGVLVEVYQTNRDVPTGDRARTGVDGRYLICAGAPNGARHDAFDVHVIDDRPVPLYARIAQPYTTYMNLGDADFSRASGLPLRYIANVTVTPNAFNTATAGTTVQVVARSKAPLSTQMQLTLDHQPNQIITMLVGTPEAGGPGAGGWNRWTYSTTVARSTIEARYWASVRGYAGTAQVTQHDRQPYVNDIQAPMFGPASSHTSQCGPGITADPFLPATTTSRRPIIVHDVCDAYSNGNRTGLDPYSLKGTMCRNLGMTLNCQTIFPALATLSIIWYPDTTLALGDYYFDWEIADMAGNIEHSPQTSKMSIVESGGQKPVFTGVFPGNFGSGSTAGVIVGSSITSPSSFPYIGFRVTDADGQDDLAPGALSVRVYYQADNALIYEYDITKAPNAYDPLTKKGGASFDLSTGMFKAEGYSLQGKPPGRYIATASISDREGNAASITWHWILAAAV